LVQVSEGLSVAKPAVARELTAVRAVWRLLYSGLPPSPTKALRALIQIASTRAKQLPQPAFAADVKRLTGPASGLAAMWERYARLAERGATLTLATSGWAAAPAPALAAYGRSVSALYIDSIYDAHFELSLIGKSIVDAYKRLGGARAFGARLTPAKVAALASAYSIPAVRLAPHPSRSIESP
jgi:hypothetical protein